VGRGDSKMVVTIPDLNLVLEITKEEAKLMGIYPAEKHEDLHKVIVLGAEENKEKTEKEK